MMPIYIYSKKRILIGDINGLIIKYRNAFMKIFCISEDIFDRLSILIFHART